jgi:hypothetical protein
MDRRRKSRVDVLLSVRVWGVDAYSVPFMQQARLRNVSDGGAVLSGVGRTVRAGEVLDVQYGDEKTQMRVIWVGKLGTPNAGEIGVQSLPTELPIWGLDLHHCSRMVGRA